jgi:hypothetical protein
MQHCIERRLTLVSQAGHRVGRGYLEMTRHVEPMRL